MSIRKDDPMPRKYPDIIREERGLWRGISDENTMNWYRRRGYDCVHINDYEMTFKPMSPPLRVAIRWGM